MRVIARKTLKDFWLKHNDSEQSLKAWYKEASTTLWKAQEDIKKEYPSASIIQGTRIVFNIKSNKYRLVVKVNYKYGIMWIRFIGKHSEYDKIDVSKI